MQTAIDLLENDLQVYIVDECIGSRKLRISKMGIERMLNNGVSLINFEMVFFELINDSKNKFLKNFPKNLLNNYLKQNSTS